MGHPLGEKESVGTERINLMIANFETKSREPAAAPEMGRGRHAAETQSALTPQGTIA
jgi:hypothetical protein